MKTILTPQAFKKMPGIRKPGTHVSEDNLQAYISEVEMLYIKPLVGDEFISASQRTRKGSTPGCWRVANTPTAEATAVSARA